MRLFILSLLAAISTGVHSHAIGYPYQSELLSYAPARGEFPVQHATAQGYIRYLDDDGSERLIGYNYPQPVYGIRRVSSNYGSNEDLTNIGLLKTSSYNEQQAVDKAKQQAREEHFRAWCQQRYLALKTEIAKLRAAGKMPSADMIAKLKPLEAIVTTNNYQQGIKESAEVKNAREEHLRIWSEARLKVLQLEAEHLKLQEASKILPHTQYAIEQQAPVQLKALPFKSYYAAIGETAEQTKAREEHLRIYNEQLLRVQQLETEHLRNLEAKNEGIKLKQIVLSNEVPNVSEAQLQIQAAPNTAALQDTDEVKRAREEHLKLVNAAKLRAQADISISSNLKADSQQTEGSTYTKTSADKPLVIRVVPGVQQPAPTTQSIQTIFSLQKFQPLQQAASANALKSTNLPTAIEQQHPGQVLDTPEVIRARDEHLKLLNEAKLKTINLQQSQSESLSQDKPIANAADPNEVEHLKAEQRFLEAERLRQTEQLHEEAKLREIENQRELERMREEERSLEEERIRLQKEEQLRLEMERLAELKLLNEANEQLIETEEIPATPSLYAQFGNQQSTFGQAAAADVPGIVILRDQYKNNPFLVQFETKSGAGNAIAGSYLIGEQKPNKSQADYYYVPSGAAFSSENPFLIREREHEKYKPVIFKEKSDIFPPAKAASVAYKPQLVESNAEHKPIFYDNLSSNMKINYGAGTELSELEKATREHFRAHEIALEQLRLANLKSSTVDKNCN